MLFFVISGVFALECLSAPKTEDKQRQLPRRPAKESDCKFEQLVEAGGRCPVCSVRDSQLKVYCQVCHTPHHHDCWNYNDRHCGMFGCAGKVWSNHQRSCN
jgi:hypothetical protein